MCVDALPRPTPGARDPTCSPCYVNVYNKAEFTAFAQVDRC